MVRQVGELVDFIDAAGETFRDDSRIHSGEILRVDRIPELGIVYTIQTPSGVFQNVTLSDVVR